MKTPYFQQETEWTCGPASLRMVLAALKMVYSEKQLVKLMGANKVHGSQQRMFEDVGQELGLEWQAQEGSSVEDVRKIIRTHFVVVNFYDAELGNGHFAVMQEVRTKFVVFGDPWFGPDRKMLIADFEDCWRPGTYGKTRWFFAVANN